VDFWIVRRKHWRVPDFYRGKGESIYWFTGGLNWRAFVAWGLAVWPSFRESILLLSSMQIACHLADFSPQAGFIAATGAITVSTAWERCFSVTWVIGFLGAAAMYYAICLVAPPPGGPFETVLMGESTSDHISGISVPIEEEQTTPEQKRPEASIKSFGGA
jgi:NCS1 family nucleobase:cation symporter-1